MNDKQNTQGSAYGAAESNSGKKDKVTSLPKMEMYVVLGLELGQRIFEKLQKVEDSLEILATQKARELNPEPSDTERAP